jgi:hypothetical protein
MTQFFKHTDNVIRKIEENDPNETRSAKVAREIQNSLTFMERARELSVR